MNARVFDATCIQPAITVSIEDGHILCVCQEHSDHTHSSLMAEMKPFPANELVANRKYAARFMQGRIDEAMVYIKLVADESGFYQQTLDSLVVKFKSCSISGAR